MNRLFGRSSAPKAPPPTIDDTSDRLDKRVGQTDGRIQKIDDELNKIREQMKRTKGPAQARLKQRAMQLLKQKRMYEGQRDQIENQRFNMDQMQFAAESVKDTIDHVACLKATATQLKTDQKKINIDDVERMQEELQDLYDDNNEIQEILGRSYGMPEEIDEEELEAELAGLEDDMLCNNDTSYLDNALAPPSELPSTKEEETDPARLEEQLGL
eukprot:TRINITY_DN187_c0_g1_i1.p1 TRINITY_DN187_c0_g1~~TRINITY_DN187_c0_g1_i1.p1  ORF type:complete len:214 (+),score=84.75 TRINITY_DN187_c0_g1_i1:1137-1778(+)